MTEDGAYQGMERFSKLSDSELGRLLGGEVPCENRDVAEVAAFFREMRDLAEVGPSQETARRHLAAMSAARVANDVGATRPLVTLATPPAPGSPVRRTWRTRMTRNPFASLRMRFAAVAAAGLTLVAFGGAAFAGVLPDPIQGAVADLAGEVGLSLPGSESTTNPPAPATPSTPGAAAQTPVGGPAYGSPQYGVSPSPALVEGPAAPVPADQPDANQVDQPDANQVDQPDANQADQGQQGNN